MEDGLYVILFYSICDGDLAGFPNSALKSFSATTHFLSITNRLPGETSIEDRQIRKKLRNLPGVASYKNYEAVGFGFFCNACCRTLGALVLSKSFVHYKKYFSTPVKSTVFTLRIGILNYFFSAFDRNSVLFWPANFLDERQQNNKKSSKRTKILLK